MMEMLHTAHAPYNKFKGWLRENGLTYDDVADVIESSKPTISRKINGQSDFYYSEIVTLVSKYSGRGLRTDFFTPESCESDNNDLTGGMRDATL